MKFDNRTTESAVKVYAINKVAEKVSEKVKKRLLKEQCQEEPKFECASINGELVIVTSLIKDTEHGVRVFGADLVRYLDANQHEEAVVELDHTFEKKAHRIAFLEGALLSTYRFDRYKDVSKSSLKNLLIVGVDFLEEEIAQAKIISDSVAFSRDLVNTPPNDMKPSNVVDAFKSMADEKVKIQVLNEEECSVLGMGAYLAVARGSKSNPKFLHATYKSKKSTKRIALVGKGVTFDTGGLSLKPPKSMLNMKSDMSGLAVVLGVIIAVSRLDLAVELHVISAIAENAVDGDSYRPDDVVKASNGKTIEVKNTDAEGRLTLADALVYTEKLDNELDYVIDIATLTGSAAVALGSDFAAIFSRDRKLVDSITEAAECQGEGVWQLPLPKSYKKLLKSEVADLSNIGSTPYGGAITAALFLEEFVTTSNWAHIDIAGCDFNNGSAENCKPNGALVPLLRTLTQWVKEISDA